MRGRVAIIGTGVSRTGIRAEASQEDLLVEAGVAAINAAGIAPGDIGASWFGCTTVSANHALLNFSLKLGYTPMTKVNNGGATGADCLRNAYLAVASGTYDIVLAAGVEKPSDAGFNVVRDGDPLTAGPSAVGAESVVGLVRSGGDAGLYLARYQCDYGIDPGALRSALSTLVIRSRKAGAGNPNAWHREAVRHEDIAQSRIAVPPLTELDIAEGLDGAAAVIVASPEVARRLGRPFAVVEAFGMSSGANEGRLRQAYPYTKVPETEHAAQRAYAMAGIEAPGKVLDHAQIYDFTSSTELMAYEDLGLAPRGKAVAMILDGAFGEEAPLRINTDGGLLSNGYQAGATGLRQVCESVRQLLGGGAEPRREDVRWSLVHTMGGSVGSYSAMVQLLRADA